MSTLAAYLRKEWRDQRTGAIGYLAMIPPMFAAAFGLLPGGWGKDPVVPTIAAAAGFAIAALMVGADLVPGELRRSKLGLLARLPGDLHTAYSAKALFYVASLLAFAGWTWLCATSASALLRDGPWFPRLQWRASFPIVALLPVGASWIFVVSCWLTRGTLALPAMVCALAAWMAPAIGAFVLNRGLPFHPGEVLAASIWLALAGFGVASLSFSHGLRYGAPWRRRLVWCVGSAAVAFVPIWGWTGVRVAAFRHLDPREPTFHMSPVALGADGRHAYVNAWHVGALGPFSELGFSASHALIVDLASGGFTAAGDAADVFLGAGRWGPVPVPIVLFVADHTEPKRPTLDEITNCYDTSTAQPLTSEQWKSLLKGPGALDAAHDRFTNFVLLPDGRRMWACAPRIYAEESDGSSSELPIDVRDGSYRACGHGFVGEATAYDCTRELAFVLRDVPGTVRFVRHGEWLLDGGDTRGGPPLKLWNPETGVSTPVARTAQERDFVVALHPDGRVVVLGGTIQDAATSGLVLLDPESGERRRLPVPPDLAKPFLGAYSLGLTAAGDLLIFLTTGTGRDRQPADWLARLDPKTDEIAYVGPCTELWTGLLACSDRDSVIVVDEGRRLVRARFGSQERELLFPRTPLNEAAMTESRR